MGEINHLHVVFVLAVFDVVIVAVFSVFSFDRTVILGPFMEGVLVGALMYPIVWDGLLVRIMVNIVFGWNN